MQSSTLSAILFLDLFLGCRMSKRACRFILALVVMIGLAPEATAGMITTIGPVSGPGGTGSVVVDSGSSSAADATLDFTSTGSLQIPLTVNGSGPYLIHTNVGAPPSLGIINNTGVPWTNLLFQVAGSASPDANAVGFDNPEFFSNPSFGTSYILLDDGTVPVGATLNVELGFVTASAGQVMLTYTPNAVPEPSSVVLLGLAILVGLVVSCRARGGFANSPVGASECSHG
jgi:PEP-CTERM motif